MKDALEEYQVGQAELHALVVSDLLAHISQVLTDADLDEESRADVYETLSDEFAGRANQIRGW